jgi:putative ABC transport system permease protein
MGYLAELLSGVLAGLARNKLRSFLTMAGIAWGVASIVLIVAMGDGFKQGQRNNTKAIGENLVFVFGGRTEKQAGGQRAGRRIRLEYRDVADIRTECFEVRQVTVELQTNTAAVSPYNSGTFNTIGVEPIFNQLRNTPVAEGRWFNERDNLETRRVAFIGDNVRKQLFGERGGVIGARISINGLPFEVIGRMPGKTQNSSYNGLDSEKVYIPYRTMVRDVPPRDATWRQGIVANVIYTPRSLDNFEAAQKQVRRVIARNHDFDATDTAAVRMWDTVEGARMVDSIFVSMTAFLGTIAVVTLTLGGIGVMNIMLVTVSERTREVGLRMAVGATRSRILLDFLVEGALLAVVSGLAGWGGAYALASIVNSFPMPEMFAGLPVKAFTTLVAFGALGLTAVASALWPAWRAAQLTPVEALRYER